MSANTKIGDEIICHDETSGRSRAAVWAGLDQLVVSATRFATTWLVGRYGGPEELGLYSLGLSIAVLFELMLQSFVTTPYTIAFPRYASDRVRQYRQSLVIQVLVISALGTISLACVALAGALWDAGLQFIVAMLVLALTMSLNLYREFSRRLHFAHATISQALSLDSLVTVAQIVLLIIVISVGQLSAATAYGCIGIAALLGTTLTAGHSIDRWWTSRRKMLAVWNRHQRQGRWLFASQLTNQLAWTLIQWIVVYWLGTTTNGVYAGCLTIIFLSNPFILAVSNVLMPRLAQAQHLGGTPALRNATFLATGMIATVMTVFSVVIALIGQEVAMLLYATPEYNDCQLVLILLVMSVSVLSLTMPAELALIVIDKARVAYIASLLGMVVSIVLALVMVRWGLSSIATALLIGCSLEAGLRVASLLWYTRKISSAE